jgi:hypothetical protein
MLMRRSMAGVVLTGVLAAACGDDPFAVEDALGVWDAEEVNGQALPGDIWLYESGDSVEIALEAVEIQFLAAPDCVFGARAQGYTPQVLDGCTYVVGEDGGISMNAEELEFSGSSDGDAMTLTDEEGNVYALRKRSTAPAPVAAVEITPPADSVRAGEEIRLTAIPRDAAGNPLIRRVTWSSDDQAVATVFSGGYVTGQSGGVATITATSEGHDGTADVTVWVGVTGSWTGTIDSPSGVCPWNLSVTESGTGAIAGTSELFAPCAAIPLDITGTNNTGGVADSVVMVFVYGGGEIRFDGSFDGEAAMTGGVTGPGPGDGPFATSFTRQSLTPAPPAESAARTEIRSRTTAYPLLRRTPG